MEVADKVSGICKNLGIPYIFKVSYRKANRTSANSFTGIGDETALALVKKVGEKYKLPTTSDVHAHDEAAMAAKYIDILQIPAFLCRQTDLLIAAAETGKVVNVKKGQFLTHIVAFSKIRKAKNNFKIYLSFWICFAKMFYWGAKIDFEAAICIGYLFTEVLFVCKCLICCMARPYATSRFW